MAKQLPLKSDKYKVIHFLAINKLLLACNRFSVRFSAYKLKTDC